MSPSNALISEDLPDPTPPITQINSPFCIERFRSLICMLSSTLKTFFSSLSESEVEAWPSSRSSVSSSLSLLMAVLIFFASSFGLSFCCFGDAFGPLAAFFLSSIFFPPQEKLAFSTRTSMPFCLTSFQLISTILGLISSQSMKFWILRMETKNCRYVPINCGIQRIGIFKLFITCKHANPSANEIE